MTTEQLTIDDLDGLPDGTPLIVRWDGKGLPYYYTLRHIDGCPFAHKPEPPDNVQLLPSDDVRLDKERVYKAMGLAKGLSMPRVRRG